MPVMQLPRPLSRFPGSYSLETRLTARYRGRLRLRFGSDESLSEKPRAQRYKHDDRNDAHSPPPHRKPTPIAGPPGHLPAVRARFMPSTQLPSTWPLPPDSSPSSIRRTRLQPLGRRPRSRRVPTFLIATGGRSLTARTPLLLLSRTKTKERPPTRTRMPRSLDRAIRQTSERVHGGGARTARNRGRAAETRTHYRDIEALHLLLPVRLDWRRRCTDPRSYYSRSYG
jgi:hypothetical protein